MKTLILKHNSEDIRNKIKQAGIDVCTCSEYKESVWLDYSGINSVHGIGYSDETVGNLSIEQELKRFMAECKEPVFCKNVDEFIIKIKEYKC